MRHWRKMTCVLILWCGGILFWMVGGAASNDCGSQADQLSQDACAVGTGIGVAVIGVLGFMGFVALSLIWFMTRARNHTSAGVP